MCKSHNIKCFNWDIFLFHEKILDHFEFDHSNMSQKSLDKAQNQYCIYIYIWISSSLCYPYRQVKPLSYKKKPCVNMILLWTKAHLKRSKGKRSGTIQLVIGSQFKSLHLWWYVGTLVPMELAGCTSGTAPSMLRFQSNICFHPGNNFQGRLYMFQQDNVKLYTC